jgi:competence protein ComEC
MELFIKIRKSPFARLLLFFIAGILTGSVFYNWHNISVLVIPSLFILLLLVIFIRLNNRPDYHTNWISGILSGLIIICTGFVNYRIHDLYGERIKNSNVTAQEFFIEVIEPPLNTDKSVKVTALIKHLRMDGQWFSHRQKILIYFEKDSNAMRLNPGDILICHLKLTRISGPRNPGEFNYQQYLERRKIYHQAFVRSDSWMIINNHKRSLRASSFAMQRYLLNEYQKIGLNNTLYSLLSAITLGYKNDLEIHTLQIFSKAGVMHVMALSGFNVAVIAVFMSYLFFFSDRFKNGKIIKTVLIVLLIWLFVWVTGLSPSVTRAAVMITLVMTGRLMQRRINTINILCVSAFILLTISPALIFDIGFQLSFAAVFGIIVYEPLLYRLIKCRYFFTDKIWQLFTVSCAAQFATMPLTLYYFHQFPVYFWLTNLFVVPLVSLITCIAGIFLLCSSIYPLMHFVGQVLAILLSILYHVVSFTEILPFAVIENIVINEFQALLMVLIILVIALFFLHRRSIFVWSVLAMLSVYGLINIKRISTWNNQQLLMVGNCKNSTAIHCIKGRKAVLFSSNELKAGDSDYQYAFDNFWMNHGVAGRVQKKNIESSGVYKADWLCNNSFFGFSGRRIIIFQDNSSFKWQSKKPLKIDILIVTGKVQTDLVSILSLIDPDLIIFDSSVKWYQAEKWSALCAAHDVRHWIVAKQGAYEAVF